MCRMEYGHTRSRVWCDSLYSRPVPETSHRTSHATSDTIIADDGESQGRDGTCGNAQLADCCVLAHFVLVRTLRLFTLCNLIIEKVM